MLDKKKIISIKKYINTLEGLVYTHLIEVNNKETILYLVLEKSVPILKIKNTLDNTEHIFKDKCFDYYINFLNMIINKNSIIKYYK